jgi:hypothetical protein
MKTKCRTRTPQTAPLNFLAALAAGLLLMSGCKHASYATFRGTGPVQGTGGTVRSIEGIEIWENGTPNRKYSILGVSDQERKGNNDKKYDKELCQLAQKHGGNAIIMVSEAPESHSRSTVKAQVIRYEP